MFRKTLIQITLLCGIFLSSACTLALDDSTDKSAGKSRSLDQIDHATYFMADVRDAEFCRMTVKNGKIKFPEKVSNPAMTCPDAFSWKLFSEVINDRFWSKWADEQQNWPPEPYKLCGKGDKPGKNCCQPGNPNNPKGHCPEFPGDKHKKTLSLLNKAKDAEALEVLKKSPEALRIGKASIMEHFLKEVDAKALRAKRDKKVDECSPGVIPGLIPKEFESIGRVIRQTNAELTIRDREFHDYLFYNNLYNSNGVANVFDKNKQNQSSNAPFHLKNRSADKKGRNADLVRIDLPPDAIMIKSNWLHHSLAKALGLKNGKKHPYITKHMATEICLESPRTPTSCGASDAKSCLLTGKHYLMAFHISSKDIPEWVWTTFEHVNLPGRCDITGCNDSFGYKSSDPAAKGSAENYLEPHKQSDLLNSPSIVFDRDGLYKAEKIRPELAKVLKALDIGTGKSTSKAEPDPEDKAWLSFRLKGSQVGFTDTTGRETYLGNSITEAGFMDGSSCITCHSRAGIHVDENGGITFFRLGVFDQKLTDYGYAKSDNGIPNDNWFHNSDSSASLDVLQTDFIWGFLNAQSLVSPKKK